MLRLTTIVPRAAPKAPDKAATDPPPGAGVSLETSSIKSALLKKPKPLLEINGITLLENTINLIKKLNISYIKINSYYLKDQIKNFISKKKFNIDIEIIDDGDNHSGYLIIRNSEGNVVSYLGSGKRS